MVQASAQFRITKRKHLKGYQIEWSEKRKESTPLTIDDKPVRAVVEKDPELVVLPVISSPTIEFAEVQTDKVTEPSSPTVKKRTQPEMDQSLFNRPGAGLVLKHPKIVTPKSSTITPDQGFLFSVIGLLATVVGIAGVITALLAYNELLVPLMSILIVVGFVFNILGYRHGNKAISGVGIAISSLAILASFLAVIAISSVVID